MSRAIRRVIVLMVCLTGTTAQSTQSTEPVSAQRQQELMYLLHQDCGSCHGMTLKGGLGPSLLPADLAGKPASYLREVIANGVPEKAMPPWKNILQPQEIDFLVQRLTRADTLSGQTP